MNGIICVYKPSGCTSFDVIAVMRRLLNTRKIGHSGTLDPLAEGVLPIFAGAATRAVDFCPDTDKQYLAKFKLGLTTDTQDISGEVLSEYGIAEHELNRIITRETIQHSLKKYIGEIEQIPPMFSAVKVDGKRLYDLARKGVTVERKPRRITVNSITIEQHEGLEGSLKIDCSKGTYIRTIIHDMGQDLGCGAVMTGLTRTRSNGFTLEDCHTLDELKELKQLKSTHPENPNKLAELLRPLDALFGYPKAFLDETQTRLFKNGAKLDANLTRLEKDFKSYKGMYSLCDCSGRIAALAKIGNNGSISIIQRFNYNE